MVETKSLEALALRVLERNAQRNAERNGLLITVSDTPKRCNDSETPERIIEATFTPATSRAPEQPIAPSFPDCPVCGQNRYWLARGMVLCGSKTCGSAERFRLLALDYRVVN